MWERGVDVPARAKAKSPSRIRIEYPSPTVDCGRWPVKRTVADTVQVSADIFRDGHEVLRAVVRWRGPGDERWREAPLIPVDAHHNGVRWEGAFTVEKPGRTQWTIQAWVDLFAGWRDELARKVEFGQPDLSGELSEGAVLLRAAADRAKGEDKRAPRGRRRGDRHRSRTRRSTPRCSSSSSRSRSAARPPSCPSPSRSTSTARSRASAPGTSSSRARGAASRASQEQLPRLAELGFDVLYMPPIHPIGHTNRKGRNNTLTRRARRSRQPVGDRRRDRAATTRSTPSSAPTRTSARSSPPRDEHGIDIALDFAINCSPDHPWLKEHPEWFFRRPDGTLKYAENPPKKYQDIYNVNFGSEDWRDLWDALLDVVRHWVDRGVKVFRVDNPHTKPFAFWEWLITEIRATDPDVIFLAEAFTRRAVMRELAKIGFTPELHVLHLEELPLGARGVRQRARPRPRGASTSGPTSSSTRRTSSPTTWPRAGRRRSRSASSWPPR